MENQKLKEQNDYAKRIATSILLQEYYLTVALKQGLEEVVCDGRVVYSKSDMVMMRRNARDLSNEDPTNFFRVAFDKEGYLNPQEVYKTSCETNPNLHEDERLKRIFNKFSRKDYNISIEDAVYAAKILEVCK